jgi:hypothetical protein
VGCIVAVLRRSCTTRSSEATRVSRARDRRVGPRRWRWGFGGRTRRLGGYVLAMAASAVVVAAYNRSFSPADNQSMGGMIAGGEMILGLGAFVLLSLLPTGLALWFVRRHRPTWSMFSSACLTFAVVGMTAALAMMGMRGSADRAPWRMLIELLGLAQMVGLAIVDRSVHAVRAARPRARPAPSLGGRSSDRNGGRRLRAHALRHGAEDLTSGGLIGPTARSASPSHQPVNNGSRTSA